MDYSIVTSKKNIMTLNVLWKLHSTLLASNTILAVLEHIFGGKRKIGNVTSVKFENVIKSLEWVRKTSSQFVNRFANWIKLTSILQPSPQSPALHKYVSQSDVTKPERREYLWRRESFWLDSYLIP